MGKTKYQLHLKGFVGDWNFDSNYVDYILDKHANEEVNVLIDSLGGRVDTALSILSAFRRHGNVNVHYVGMNASAATIAGLGAKRITIASSAMYLVHKCSNIVFKWANLNADQIEAFIDELKAQKKNQDTIDINIATQYSVKCKKDKEALLELMKEGGWLSAQQALEWGFVDEIIEDSQKITLPEGTIKAMVDAGMPLPCIEDFKEESTFSKFLNSIASLFRSNSVTQTITIMQKKFQFLCALLAIDILNFADGKTSLDEAQVDAIENKFSELDKEIENLKNQLQSKNDEIEALKKTPGDSTSSVVDDGKKETNPTQDFFDRMEEAKKMLNSI